MSDESNSSLDDEPTRYVVRVTLWARNEVDQAQLAIEALSGLEASLDWEQGFWESVETLRIMPYRAVARETVRFPFEVRQLVYRRTGSSYAHRILYTIQETSQWGSAVFVIHVRHGSRDDISAMEARIITQQTDLQSFMDDAQDNQ